MLYKLKLQCTWLAGLFLPWFNDLMYAAFREWRMMEWKFCIKTEKELTTPDHLAGNITIISLTGRSKLFVGPNFLLSGSRKLSISALWIKCQGGCK